MKRIILTLAVLIVALRFLPWSSPGPSSAPAAPAVQTAQSWTCAMHPSVAAAAPGACPICGMDLVTRSRADPAAEGGARIEYSPARERAADIRTAKVVRGYPRVAVQLSGRVTEAAAPGGVATLTLNAFPADLPFLRFGQRVALSGTGLGGVPIPGRIAQVGERVDPRTNTVSIDVRAANADGRLRAGLPVSGVVKLALAGNGDVLASELRGKWLCPDEPEVISDAPGRCPSSRSELQPAERFGYVTAVDEHAAPILVPDTAPLVLGKRAIVYVREADGPIFTARPVVLGARADGVYTVQSGLTVGEIVVVNGAVRIDSDLQIRGLPSLLSSAERRSGMSAPPVSAQTQGPLR